MRELRRLFKEIHSFCIRTIRKRVVLMIQIHSKESYPKVILHNMISCTCLSDKLRLSELDLTHKGLATEQDRKYQLDQYGSALMRT